MTNMKLSGPEVSPVSKNKAKQLIVFLHGVGADGDDLISFAEPLSKVFPDAHFVSPNGPQKYDMSPHGHQWFSLMDRTREKMFAGAKNAAPMVNDFLDEQLKRFNLKDENIALVGFSQGTMMALYSSLRREKPIGAVLGFSGAFLHSKELAGEIKSKPPICLVHGTYDQIVPFVAMADADAQLQALGVKVEVHSRPGLGHGVDLEAIEIGIKFLKNNLK